MLILVEGPDGAGKSTLVDALQTAVMTDHGTATTTHAGPPRRHPILEYEVPLWRYRPDSRRVRICDRWHWGERVYPTIFSRRTELTDAVWAHIELFLRSRGAVVVHVTAHPDTLRERLLRRGDPDVSPAAAAHAARLFQHTARQSILPHVTVDETYSTASAVETALRIARERAYEVNRLRQYVTYVGSPRPRLLLLGDVRGVDGRFARPNDIGPAFVPYAPTSGHYLLSALTRVCGGIPDVGLANACDVDDVAALWRDLGQPPVVALGGKSHRQLGRLNVPHRVAPHPQWVRRFHHSMMLEYAGQLIYDVEPQWN